MKKNLMMGVLACFIGGILSGCDPSAEVAGAIKDKLEDTKMGDSGSSTEEGEASAGGEMSFATITKAQYLTMLDCYLTKVGNSAQASAAVGAVKLQLDTISDEQWNASVAGTAGLSFKVYYDLAIKEGCSV